MDFASLMRSQIESTDSAQASANKKYLRRAEVEAQRREAYEQEQRQAETARQERLEKKRKRDDEDADRQRALKEKKARLAEESRVRVQEEALIEENARRKRIGLSPLPVEIEQPVEDLEGIEDIQEEELRENLRQLGEPVILFAETHAQRLKRWTELSNQQILSSGPIPTTLPLLEEKDMKLSQKLPATKDERKHVRRQLVSYFDLVLSEWLRALAQRPKEVKESFSGKQAYKNYATALSNLTPMFRKLETDTVQDDILKPIIEIAFLAQSKRYVDANDAYLRLSIGNTAWPIGVTMVGIHERSAREKLHEDETAHIMSDEVTRKMIQGIKRTLTFAQTRWPPDDFAQLMG